MKQIVKGLALFALIAALPLGRATAQVPPAPPARPPVRTGEDVRNLIIEDSLTPAKAQLRNYVAELRDSLVRVESVQAQIQRARQSKMKSVVMSQGRQLGRTCASGMAMVDLTSERILPMNTPDPRGDQALHGYRSALTVLREDLRQCAHYDSVTMNTASVDEQKLENIATAARDAINRYDLIRDGLMALLDITLPIKGTIRKQ